MGMVSGRSNLVDIKAELKHETAHLFIICDGKRTVSVPKILVEYDPSDSTFAMPKAIAKDRGLI